MSIEDAHYERQDAIFNADSALKALDHDSPLDDVKITWEKLIRTANELRDYWDTDSSEIVNGSQEYALKRADFVQAVEILSEFANSL